MKNLFTSLVIAVFCSSVVCFDFADSSCAKSVVFSTPFSSECLSPFIEGASKLSTSVKQAEPVQQIQKAIKLNASQVLFGAASHLNSFNKAVADIFPADNGVVLISQSGLEKLLTLALNTIVNPVEDVSVGQVKQALEFFLNHYGRTQSASGVRAQVALVYLSHVDSLPFVSDTAENIMSLDVEQTPVFIEQGKISDTTWNGITDGVVYGVFANDKGKLSLAGSKVLCQTDKGILCAFVQGGEIVEVIDSAGKSVLLEKTELAPVVLEHKRMFWAGAELTQTGQVKGGIFIGSANPNAASDLFAKYPDCVVTNLSFSNQGLLRFAGQLLCERKNLKGQLVHAAFDNGKLIRVCSAEDGNVLVSAKELKKFSFWADAQLAEDGSIAGGTEIKPEFKTLPADILEQYPNAVVCDFVLDGKGRFYFAGKERFSKSKFAGKRVHIRITDGDVTKVVDADTAKVLQDKSNLVKRKLWAGATLGEKGTRQGGRAAAVLGRIVAASKLSKYEHCVVTNVAVSATGTLSIAGQNKYSLDDYAGQLTDVEFENGRMVKACLVGNGKVLFDLNSDEQSQFWADAELSAQGQITGGKLLGAASAYTLSKYMAQHPTCVVTSLSVSADGRIFAAGRDWTVGKKLAGEIVNVAFKDGLPVKLVRMEDNEILLDKLDFSKRSLYAGAQIGSDGKMKSGVFVGVANQNVAEQMLGFYPDCVVLNLTMAKRGRLLFAGKSWCERKEFEGDTVHAQFKDGKLVRLSRVADGKIIFDKLDVCQFHAGAGLTAKGQLKGGRLIGHANPKNISSLLTEFPDAVVSDITVTDAGHLEIGRRIYSPELAGQRVHALFKNGELEKVVLVESGEKVFPELRKPEIFTQGAVLASDGSVAGGVKGSLDVDFKTELTDCIMTHMLADRDGRVLHNGKLLFEDVTAAGQLLNLMYLDGQLVEVCSARSGKRFFKLHDLGLKTIYDKAALTDDFKLDSFSGKGQRVSSLDAAVMEKFTDCVVTGLSFDMKGRLRLGGKCAMVRSKFAGQSAVVQVKNGELFKVGLIDGTKVYLRKEHKPKSIWINADLNADGTVDGGTKVGDFDSFVPKQVLSQNPDCVVDNAQLNTAGQLRLGDKMMFYNTRFAKKYTSAIIRNGELAKLIVKGSGEVIFPTAAYDEIEVYPGGEIDIETGAVVGGGKYGTYKRSVPPSVFQALPDFAIKGLTLDISGTLKLNKQIWFTGKDFAEKKVNARFAGGRLMQLYAADSGECLVDTDRWGLVVYVAQNTAWDGFRFSGFNARDAGLSENFVLTNVAVPPESVVTGVRKAVFCGRPVDFSKLDKNAKWLDVVFSKSRPVEIYDDKGRLVWSEQSYQMSAISHVEKDGAMVPYSCKNVVNIRNQLSDAFVQENLNFTVTGVSSSLSGNIILAKQRLFLGLDCVGVNGLLVDFKNGLISRVYDWDGTVYYDLDVFDKMKQPNAVWLRLPNENGGQFINAWPHGLPSDLLERYPSCWVKGIDVNSELLASAFANLKHIDEGDKKELIAGFKDGVLKTVMLPNGKKIYDWAKPMQSVYSNAVMRRGKLVSGDRVYSGISGVPVSVVGKNPDCVVLGVSSSSVGNLEIAGHKWPLRIAPSLKELTVVFRHGVLYQVFSASGQLLAHIDENTKNAVFKDYKIDERGKVVDGKFLYAYPGGISQRLAQEMGNFVATGVELNSRGGLSIAGSVVWEGKGSLARKKVNVVFKNGLVDEVYRPGTGLIYSYHQEYPELNSLYTSPEIKQGKLVGGELVGHYAGRNSRQLNTALISSLTDAAFDKVPFGPDGTLRLGEFVLLPPNAEYSGGTSTALVKINNGSVESAYDANGKSIFPVFNGVDISSISRGTQGAKATSKEETKILDQAFEDGKMDSMVETLGLRGAIRILAGIFDMDTATVSTYLTGMVFSGSFNSKFTPTPEGVFSFHNMRRVDEALLERISRHSSGFEGFSRAVKNALYKNVVADPRFLDVLAAESVNENNNSVLRRVYAEILDHFSEVASMPINGINPHKRVLKFYQREGVKFILDNKKVILADDQGVGKTLQVIAAALNINEGKGAQKALIISPYGAKQVWEDEIQVSVLGDEKPYIIDSLQELENPKKLKKIQEARFVIVNYEAIRSGSEELQEELGQMGFDFIAVDEAHKLRNESLQTMAVRRFQAPYQVLVTGTPLVGRRVGKIYNLLNWLFPDVFTNSTQSKHFFATTFARNGTTMRSLGAMLDFFVLRRLKNDVLVELPERSFVNHYLESDTQHKAFYAKVYEEFLSKNIDNANMGRVIALIQKLKKIAIHPELERQTVFLESKSKGGPVVELELGQNSFELNGKKYTVSDMEDFFSVSHVTGPDGKEYASRLVPGPSKLINIDGQDFYINSKLFVEDCAKFKKLRQIVDEAVAKGESVVVFTTYRNAVAALAREFNHNGAYYLVGNMQRRARKRQIDEFSQHGGVFISTFGSGGETITLTKANHVVLLDLPWTAQDRNQAIDRIYRLGQDRDVTVHSLISSSTIDEHVISCIDESQLVFDLVFDSTDAQMTEQGNISRIVESLQGAKQKTSVSNAHKRLGEIYKNHSYSTDFKNYITVDSGNNLKAFLEDNSGVVQEFSTLPGLLQGFASLSAGSKQMVAEFIKDALIKDFIEDKNISQTMLWQLVCSMKGILKEVDYHPEIYRGTVAGVAVAAVMLGADIQDAKQLEEFIGMPGVVNEGLRFCDRENVFKALSFLGILDSSFYYSAQLLKSYSTQSFAFGDGRVSFRDEELVNSIAPGFLGKATASGQIAWPDVQGRLAMEARRGNLAAREVLLLGCFESVRSVAFRVRKGMQRRFMGPLAANIPDVDSLIQDCWSLMLENIDEWYEEVALMPIEQIAERDLPKKLNKIAYGHMRTSLKQLKLIDAPVKQGENGTTYGDLYFSQEVDYLENMEPEPAVFAQDSAAFDMVRDILELPENGFMPHEIDSFIMHVSGMNAEQIKNQLAGEGINASIESIEIVLEDAAGVLAGDEFFKEMLQSRLDAKAKDGQSNVAALVDEDNELVEFDVTKIMQAANNMIAADNLAGREMEKMTEVYADLMFAVADEKQEDQARLTEQLLSCMAPGWSMGTHRVDGMVECGNFMFYLDQSQAGDIFVYYDEESNLRFLNIQTGEVCDLFGAGTPCAFLTKDGMNVKIANGSNINDIFEHNSAAAGQDMFELFCRWQDVLPSAVGVCADKVSIRVPEALQPFIKAQKGLFAGKKLLGIKLINEANNSLLELQVRGDEVFAKSSAGTYDLLEIDLFNEVLSLEQLQYESAVVWDFLNLRTSQLADTVGIEHVFGKGSDEVKHHVLGLLVNNSDIPVSETVYDRLKMLNGSLKPMAAQILKRQAEEITPDFSQQSIARSA